MANNPQASSPARVQGRTLYLDLLRVIASLLVVVIHVNSANFRSVDVASDTFLAFSFFAQYAHVAVPIFVMISGALFLDERRSVTYDKIIKRNIPHVAIPFFFWSTAYALVYSIAGKSTIGKVMNVLAAILKGSLHLWFLPMIAGLYLITPLLRTFTEDKGLERAFLLLGLIFAVCLPTLDRVGGLVESKSVTTLLGGLQGFVGHFHFRFAMEYSLYYVLGHYLARDDLKVPRGLTTLVGIAALAIGSWLAFYASNISGSASTSFHNNFNLSIFLGSCALFLLAMRARIDNWPAKAQAALVAWSDTTFGVYLVHVFFIRSLAKVGINSLMCNALVAIPATSALVYLLSLVTSYLIRRIPALGKWIS